MDTSQLFKPLQALSLNDVEVTGKEIGRGAYGVVLEVKVSGLSCAGKKLHDAIAEEYLVKKFIDECLNHSQLRHPNIVQLMGVYFPPDSDTPILVMERLQVSLAQCLDEAPLPLSVKYNILLDVANGLNYLHRKSPPIIHRDLTAQNILLTKSFNAKIADLGVLKRLDPVQSRRLTLGPGNAAVMPPEAFNNQMYDHKLDVFSYGCLILHIFTQDWPIPVNQLQIDPLNEWQRRFAYVTKMGGNHAMLPIARECLQNDPVRRPVMSDIISLIQSTLIPIETSTSIDMSHLYDEMKEKSEANYESIHDTPIQGAVLRGKKSKSQRYKTPESTGSHQEERPHSSITNFIIPPPLPPRITIQDRRLHSRPFSTTHLLLSPKPHDDADELPYQLKCRVYQRGPRSPSVNASREDKLSMSAELPLSPLFPCGTPPLPKKMESFSHLKLENIYCSRPVHTKCESSPAEISHELIYNTPASPKKTTKLPQTHEVMTNEYPLPRGTPVTSEEQCKTPPSLGASSSTQNLFRIDHTMAKSILMKQEKKNGIFFVWLDKNGEHYISVYHDRVVTHIRIYRNPRGSFSLDASFCTEEKSFTSIDELVKHYRKAPLHFKEGQIKLQ